MTTATEASNWRPSDNLQNRLRLVRAELGLSQKEAADRAGITARVWQSAEDGRTIRSERAVLGAIAMAFGLDRDWLTWGGSLNAENPHPDDPNGGLTVRHQGLEPRTHWYGVNRRPPCEVIPIRPPTYDAMPTPRRAA